MHGEGLLSLGSHRRRLTIQFPIMEMNEAELIHYGCPLAPLVSFGDDGGGVLMGQRV